ncbi:hypothetical protein C4K39_5917 [Pseudomonas sessilinigenes]|nr:hypothetical protein C4K39_5917 [Pseudomonas sessilinigenes]
MQDSSTRVGRQPALAKGCCTFGSITCQLRSLSLQPVCF